MATRAKMIFFIDGLQFDSGAKVRFFLKTEIKKIFFFEEGGYFEEGGVRSVE